MLKVRCSYKFLIIHYETLVSANENMDNEMSNVALGGLPMPHYCVCGQLL